MEVTLVKEVIITPLLLDDETAAKTFSITKEHAGTCRREMKDIPRWNALLSDHGRLVDTKVFKHYLDYRGSVEWKNELETNRKKLRRLKK